MEGLIDQIAKDVLNDPGMLKLAYRRLSLKQFFSGMMYLPKNILIMGESQYWLVIAATAHPAHFIGTQRSL